METLYRIYLKRLCDLIVAIFILPFVVVAFIIITPIIYLSDKGNVFYVSKRIGLNGNIFNMYKFRSMRIDAPDLRNHDGSTFNSSDDSRVTKIGRVMRKTSLDELPQIINVLKGDMSIIGPRPDLPDALNIYNENEKKKLQVKPGITGYNQAYYRNSISQSERFKNDVYYSQNISFTLDIKIFFSTIITVLKQRNINSIDEEN